MREQVPSEERQPSSVRAPPGGRWRGARVLALVGAGLALAAGGAGLVLRARPSCGEAGRALEGVWDAPGREALHRAFLETRKPYAEMTWRGVEKGLEGYTRAWGEMQREACEATRVRGEQPEEVLALRLQCLERRRQEVEALVKVLASVDGQGLVQASRLMERLTPLETCANVAELAGGQRLPEEPAVRRKLEVLREQLAQVRARTIAGRYAEGVKQASALAEAAEATGFRPLMAETWLELSRLQYFTDDIPGAIQSAHRSARAFLASGQMEGVVRAWLELVTSLQLQGPPAAQEQEQWLRYIEEGILAAGNPPALRAESERRLAYIRNLQGRHEEALEHARKAVELQERLHGPESVEVANALLEVMRAGAFVGRYEEAMAAGQRALVFWKATVGLEHPSTLRVLNLIGVVQAMSWHLPDSAATYEQVLTILKRLPDTEDTQKVAALNNLAVIYFEQGAHAEGEPLIAEALALLDKNQSRASVHGVICLQSLADSKNRRGEHAEALRLSREALELAEKVLSPQHVALPTVLTTLGEAELGLGHAARAQSVLERALRQREDARRLPKEQGETRFALARALEAQGVERPRMLELLTRARRDFEQAGASAEWLRAEWDGWVKARGLESLPELRALR